MGLGGILNKLSGKDNKGGDVFLFVFGSDKRFCRRNMESQGDYVQHNATRMGYFTSPQSNGVLSRQSHGMVRNMGPVSVACETITELFSFPNLAWPADRNAKVTKDDNGHYDIFEDDPIIDNAWSEGWSLAGQRQDNTETRNKLLQILLVAVLGMFALALIVAAGSGLLGDLASNAGKFFGGG